MRIGIRTKQVAGVMAIVSLALTVLGGWYLASLHGGRKRPRRTRLQDLVLLEG